MSGSCVPGGIGQALLHNAEERGLVERAIALLVQRLFQSFDVQLNGGCAVAASTPLPASAARLPVQDRQVRLAAIVRPACAHFPASFASNRRACRVLFPATHEFPGMWRSPADAATSDARPLRGRAARSGSGCSRRAVRVPGGGALLPVPAR